MTNCLTDLFCHNRWANLQMIDFCAELPDAQLDATVPGTYGSIRAALSHIVDTERFYVAFIQSPERPAIAYWHENYPPFDTLRHEADRTGRDLIELARAAEANEVLERIRHGRPYTIPLGVMFAQVITHAVDHRSQIATILTQLGIEPPDLDGWAFNESAEQG